jgi:hypothetical protein
LTDTLHQLLEPETNSCWLDEYLLGECNFSRVNWVATANSITHLDASLLSRFEVFEPPKPTTFHCSLIFHSVVKNILTDIGFYSQAQRCLFESFEIEAICHQAKSLRHFSRLIQIFVGKKLLEYRENLH